MESATGERLAAKAKAPVLYHIEISHHNEKARWALDYKGIPHVRKAPPPLLHMAWALWLTRSPTFPVLKHSERLGGSQSLGVAGQPIVGQQLKRGGVGDELVRLWADAGILV